MDMELMIHKSILIISVTTLCVNYRFYSIQFMLLSAWPYKWFNAVSCHQLVDLYLPSIVMVSSTEKENIIFCSLSNYIIPMKKEKKMKIIITNIKVGTHL